MGQSQEEISGDAPGSVGDGKLQVLRIKPFRMLLSARTISYFGDSLTFVALPFAVLSLGGGATDIGLVLGAGTVANLALILVGGAVADKVPRRALLIASDLLQASVMAAMSVLLVTGTCEVWHLVVLQAFFGAGAALNLPAFSGMVPQVVDSANLKAANSLISVCQSSAQIMGPAIAGVLVGFGSPALALEVDAFSFLVSAVLLWRLKVNPGPAPDERLHLLNDIRAGWVELVRRRWYWVSLCAHSTVNFASAVFYALGPVIVVEEFNGSVSWGFIAAAGSVGSLLGGLTLLRMKLGRPLVVGNLAVALFALPPLLLASNAPLWCLVAAAGFGAAGISVLNGAWHSTVQQILPGAILSRLSSYDWLISLATMPLGFALAGPLSERFGATPLLVVVAIVLVVACVGTLLDPGVRNVVTTKDGLIEELDHGREKGRANVGTAEL